MSEPWRVEVRFAELTKGPRTFELEPDAAQRAQIARATGLVGLPALRCVLETRPWLDGAELRGRIAARVEQTCGVSLERFEQDLEAEFELRLVPAGSPNAPSDDAELDLDLDGPEPPDVLEGEEVDLAAYVVEQLSLEIDPFPRKPGAAFEYDAGEDDDSPFAALKRLHDPKT